MANGKQTFCRRKFIYGSLKLVSNTKENLPVESHYFCYKFEILNFSRFFMFGILFSRFMLQCHLEIMNARVQKFVLENHLIYKSMIQ